MSNLREAAQQALDALAGYRREMNLIRGESYMHGQPCDAEIALRAALAEHQSVDAPLRRCHQSERSAMTRDQIDVVWQQAMHDAIAEGEQMTRYRFAEMVSAIQRQAEPTGKKSLQVEAVVTGNEFHGAPPEPYANWGDAIAAMLDRGVIRGLRISALVQDQDPELSAALGWPGGISDPVLDRETLLQQVARLVERAHGIGEEAT